MVDSLHPWSRTRIDVLTHERTGWFSALEHTLRLQCQCADAAGILERSIASIARIASGDRSVLTVTPEMVRASITRLQETGHVMWFDDLEVLWWVEMADEQQPDPGPSRARYWAKLAVIVRPKLGNQLRAAVQSRYPCLVDKKSLEIKPSQAAPPKLVNQVGFSPLDLDSDRDSDLDPKRERKTGDAGPTRRARRARKRSARQVDAALIDAVIDSANKHRSSVIDGARGLRRTSESLRGWVAKATKRENASLADWELRLGHLAEAARRDDFWVPHLTSALEHLHRRRNWERWGHASAIPRRARKDPGFAPNTFDTPGSREELGDTRAFDNNIDPNEAP